MYCILLTIFHDTLGIENSKIHQNIYCFGVACAPFYQTSDSQLTGFINWLLFPNMLNELYGIHRRWGDDTFFFYRGNDTEVDIFYHKCVVPAVIPGKNDFKISPTKRTIDATYRKSENTSDIMTLLIGFFDYYATFDNRGCAVSFDNARNRSRSRYDNLVVSDPFLHTRNVTLPHFV
ncbi:hypothetical protein BCR42DRAFT_396030 [Absidia repens]|uniref:PAP-associated domain-containing protein n=1 Tax=Absidia repens TaxID=90262 RepID=A0A1X2I5F7_9FUNG|nr:hypothetical protein BCR42DRAFT_396030 [Absidia repens]